MSYSQSPNKRSCSPRYLTQCAQNSAETIFPLRHAATLACVALTKEMDDYDERFFRCSSIDNEYVSNPFDFLHSNNKYRAYFSIEENFSDMKHKNVTSEPSGEHQKYQMFNSVDFDANYDSVCSQKIEDSIPETLWKQINSNDECKDLNPDLINALMEEIRVESSNNNKFELLKSPIDNFILPSQASKATPTAFSAEEVDTSLIPLDENGMLTSMGSINHALGTCRPCAFTNNPRKEGCVNGIQCAFCHFKHPTKRKLPRLSKHQRLLRKYDKAKLSNYTVNILENNCMQSMAPPKQQPLMEHNQNAYNNQNPSLPPYISVANLFSSL